MKVDLLSGLVTKIWETLLTGNVAVENGTLFFVEFEQGLDRGSVYRAVGNSPPEKFLTGADVGLLTITGLRSGNGMLFIEEGRNSFIRTAGRMAMYNLSTGLAQPFIPIYYPESYFFQDQSLYAYTHSGNGVLMRIPLDKPLRPIVEVSPRRAEYGAVQSMAREGDDFYWIWENLDKGFPSKDFRISKATLGHPGPAEDLFQSTLELRDIAVHNGRIYFSCLDQCGGAGWVLASLPLGGGPVERVIGLGKNPSLFHLNGIFYLADDFDTGSALVAINLEEGLYTELLNRLGTNLVLRASSKWLYIGQLAGNGKISRYPIVDWSEIGPEEEIVQGTGSLMPGSISTDGAYLYYWDGALKRVAE